MSSFTESHEFGCVRKTQLHGPSPCFHPSPALHPLPPPSVLNTVAQETAQNQRSDPVTHVSTSAPNFLRAEAKVHRVAPETLQEAAPCPLSPPRSLSCSRASVLFLRQARHTWTRGLCFSRPLCLAHFSPRATWPIPSFPPCLCSVLTFPVRPSLTYLIPLLIMPSIQYLPFHD